MFIFVFNGWVKVQHVCMVHGVIHWYNGADGETYYPCEVKAFCQH